MKTTAWTRTAIAGLTIATAAMFTVGSSAFAADPKELQLKGQPASKLVEVLGEPQEKAAQPDGGQLYLYTYEHVLKGGHIMSAMPKGKLMSQDMTHQCRAEFNVSREGMVRDSGITGKGCPTK